MLRRLLFPLPLLLVGLACGEKPPTEPVAVSVDPLPVTPLMQSSSARDITALLYYAEPDNAAQGLKQGLMATGLFPDFSIDLLPMAAEPASLLDLQDYTCVYAWTGYPNPAPVAVGDRLQEYVIGGGQVILGVMAYSRTSGDQEMQGGIMTAEYSPLVNTDVRHTRWPAPQGSLDFLTAFSEHPVLDGVGNFEFQASGAYANVTLTPGATLIGVDEVGVPLIAQSASTSASTRVTGFNVYFGVAAPDFGVKSSGVYRALANACNPPAPPNTPPVADAGADQTILVNQPTTLEGSATDADPDDEIVEWNWTVTSAPDGSAPPLSDPNRPDPTFSGNMAGDYVLALTASDGTDWSARDEVTIFVRANQPPVAVATADPVSGPDQLYVQFDGSGSSDPEGGPLDYLWRFGDGGISSDVSPTHVYSSPATYTAQLEVEDDALQTATATIEITVLPFTPPVAVATAEPTSGPAPLEVQFDGGDSYDPEGQTLSYIWRFGDGGVSSQVSPMYTYSSPGTFIAVLEVQDRNLQTDMVTIEITVLPSVITVTIDMPGTDENAVNPTSKGVVPIAVFGSSSLDVNDIDRTTLGFGPNEAAPTHKALGHLEDVNGDGYMDLVVHFRAQETGIAAGDTEACLSGQTMSGASFNGCIAITTVGDKERKEKKKK